MVAENAQPGNTDINKSIRVMSVESDDLLIEAMVPEKRQGLYKYISFRASAVEHIAAHEVKNAQIVLHSGVAISVGMDARELTKMIFEPDFKTGRRLDLTAVTGVNVKTVWPENMNLKPGMKAEDGSIYLGFDGNKDWYMAANDLCAEGSKTSMNASFNTAAAAAASYFHDHGHSDWKIPEQATLEKVYELLGEKNQPWRAEFNLVSKDYVTATIYDASKDSIKTYNPVSGKSDWWSKEYQDNIHARLVRSVSRGAP